jgi:hypothetical protein
MRFFVLTLSGREFTVDSDLHDTIASLKVKVHADGGPNPAVQRIIFCGRECSDFDTLESCGIQSESTFHLVVNATPTVSTTPNNLKNTTTCPPRRQVQEPQTLTTSILVPYQLSEAEGPIKAKVAVDNRQIVLTPIARDYKKKGPDSRKDWEEQLSLSGGPKNWDSWKPQKSHQAKAGDLFVVVFRRCKGVDGRVEIYPITDSHGTEDRLSTWAQNIGQTDRHVIDLGTRICELTWDEWAELNGDQKPQGTMRCNKNRAEILNHVDALALAGSQQDDTTNF